MKRPASLVVPAILLGILLCGSLIIMLIAGAEPPAARVRVVAVLKTIDVNMEFWEVVKSGMREAAKEFDVDLDVRGPWAESDVLGQLRIVDEVIAERPTAIILAATDYVALVGSVEKARDEGIRVVTLDSGVDSSVPATFVATNNVEAGEKAGVEMARLLKPGAAVAVVNHIRGATTAMEREKGALRAVGEGNRFTVLGVWYTNNFVENAYAIALDLMDKHPDLGGILAMNEVSTVGVARALRDRGRLDIRLVGFDNSLVEIKLMEEGFIDATVIQQPFNMGYLAVRAVRRVVGGGSVEPFIDTGSLLVTPENMYLPEIQKSLFPFAESRAPQ
jgi:ribose transport system substrate-binding protein